LVVAKPLGVRLVILVSLWDLISLTLNWHFADLGALCFVNLEGNFHTLLILFASKEEKKLPETKAPQRLKEVAVRLRKEIRPPHSMMFDSGRFASILRPRNSEAASFNQKEDWKRVARSSHPIGPSGSRQRMCSCRRRHPPSTER
jgi:hypothetical protein